jgi:hypothetical protein
MRPASNLLASATAEELRDHVKIVPPAELGGR